MMNRRSQGFTLIELVVVIAILSILAAIALPRFAALQADARLAKMNAAMGSVKSAAAMAHGLLIARGHGESFSGTPEPRIIIEGQEVNYHFGYPTVETIAALAGLHEPDYVVGGRPVGTQEGLAPGTIAADRKHTGLKDQPNCTITYEAPGKANDLPGYILNATLVGCS